MDTSSRRVTVVGAGIVGVCCAAWLQRKGWQVTLLDRDEPGHGASFGNSGVLSPSAVLPVALPGMLRQVPGWLLDPLGPLTIRWPYLPRLAPWLLRFLRCANVAQMDHSANAMGSLTRPAFECYDPLLKNAGALGLIQGGGSLFVYESEQEFQADRKSMALRRRFGIEFEEMSEQDVRRLEPALAPRFRWGVLAPENRRTVNPRRLTQALADQVCADGGRFQRAEVRDIRVLADGRKALRTADGELHADTVLVATGAWSGPLAAGLGDRVPLESQRGYHVTFANPGVTVHRSVSWVRRRVFVAPMEMGLRIAGTVELAGLSAAPNWSRAEGLARTAAEMFPDLDSSSPSRWMGHRPCLPDSLPVIGAATRALGVFYAFGHQHVGMCSAATTGRSVAELLSGEQPQVDLRPFRPDRF